MNVEENAEKTSPDLVSWCLASHSAASEMIDCLGTWISPKQTRRYVFNNMYSHTGYCLSSVKQFEYYQQCQHEPHVNRPADMYSGQMQTPNKSLNPQMIEVNVKITNQGNWGGKCNTSITFSSLNDIHKANQVLNRKNCHFLLQHKQKHVLKGLKR